jgi:hypothetical protein
MTIRLLLSLLLGSIFFCLKAQEIDSTMWIPDGPVNAIVRIGNTVYLGGGFKTIGPKTGSGTMVDITSGHLLEHQFPQVEGTIRVSLPDGKGGWYLGGSFKSIQGVARASLAHILPNGTLDRSWNPPYKESIKAMAIYGNTLYVGGKENYWPGKRLAAIDLITGKEISWNPKPDGEVNALVTVGNTVYIGGAFTSIDGQPRNRLAAVDAVTNQLTSWDPNASYDVNAILFANNTLYIGGKFSNIGAESRKHLTAVDPISGKPTSWNPQIEQAVTALGFGDNTLVAGGIYSSFTGLGPSLAAFNTGEGAEMRWKHSLDQPANSIQVKGSTAFIGGSFTQVHNTVRKGAVAVQIQSGTLLDWNPNVSGEVFTLSIAPQSILIGGNFTTLGSIQRNGLVAIDARTGKPTPWDPNLKLGTEDGYVYSLARFNNTLYIGGNFSHIRGQARSFLGAVNAETGQPTPWAPQLDGAVDHMVCTSTTLYLAGNFKTIDGKPRKRLGSFDRVTGQVSAWNPSPDDRIDAIAVSSGTVYVGGYFRNIGGKKQSFLAAIDANGEAKDWNPSVGLGVKSIAAAANTVYVGVNFRSINDQYQRYLVAFDATTAKLKEWNTDRWIGGGVLAEVTALYLSGDSLYIGGRLTDLGTTSVMLQTVSLKNDRSASFSPSFNSVGTVSALEVSNGVIYIGGKFSQVENRAFTNFVAFGKNKLTTNAIAGKIYEDVNQNCQQDSGEKGLPNRIIVGHPGNYIAFTDSSGNYSIPVSVGTYTVSALPTKDQSIINQQVCPKNPVPYTVAFSKAGEVVKGIDFAFNTSIQKSLLKIGVISSQRRRCFSSTTTITYGNAGNADADSVKVYVRLPEYVRVLSSNTPYKVDQDNLLVFTIGKLGPGQDGQIQLKDSVVCGISSIRSLTQCTRVWITSSSKRDISASWDQSDISLKAACKDNGFIRLGIYNTGTGVMADSSAFRIFLDAKLAFQSNFKLAKGDSLILHVPANGRTVRLEADQRPNHPSKSQSSITLEACGTHKDGTISKGFVAQIPADDEEPEVDEECLPIVDSFDPNDKLSFPVGTTAEKYTPTKAELDYSIRFQNTGTDVAYKVVVVDTLSEHLDITTLQIRGASHKYRFSVSGKGQPVLTWAFDNIMLPDSTTNRLGSNGFVHFSIKPKKDLSAKTRIENFADIFFDYNEPVRTNTTLNTIYDVPQEVVQAVKLNQTVICNPANSTVSAGLDRLLCGQDTVHLEGSIALKSQGHWKNIQGTGTIQQPNNPTSLVTELGLGQNIFEWCVPTTTCGSDTLRARVTITRYPGFNKPTIHLVGQTQVFLLSSVEGPTYTWKLNGTALDLNTRTIKVSQPGAYTVQVSGDGNCQSPVSEVYQFVITALEATSSTYLRIYPNPNSGRFTVELPANAGAVLELMVLDPLGRVFYQQGNGNLEEINLINAAAGTYFIKVQTSKGVFVGRVVKH